MQYICYMHLLQHVNLGAFSNAVWLAKKASLRETNEVSDEVIHTTMLLVYALNCNILRWIASSQ